MTLKFCIIVNTYKFEFKDFIYYGIINSVGGDNMKKIIAKMNIPLLIFTLLYSILGLIMIFSASSVAAVLRYGYDSNHFFIRQLLWLLMGYACGFIVLFVPTKFYRYGSKLGMFGMIMLLILVRQCKLVMIHTISLHKLLVE